MASTHYLDKAKKLFVQLSKACETSNYNSSQKKNKAILKDAPERNKNLLNEQIIDLEDLDNYVKLDTVLINQFERAFGADFRDVTIHTGAYAEEIARNQNAEAVTIGNDIYFAPGKYAPGTEDGIKLLAHELQHVVQNQNKQRMTFFEDISKAENEAENVESALENIDLHNLESPLLDQSSIPNIDTSNSSNNSVTLNKSSADYSDSLEDFVNSNQEILYEIKNRDGSKTELNKKEYSLLMDKFQDKVSNWLHDQQECNSQEDYEKLITSVYNNIN